MNYSYKTLWINGRFVTLNSILEESVTPYTAFENETFLFIRQWLSGKETFTLQTSGSTGAPKQITFERDQMIASATATQQALQLKPNYSALVCIDTKYIGGKMMLVRSFVTNMQIWAVDPCACPLQKIPVDHCVNFAAFVPYQVTSMLGSKHPHLLDNADVVIIGGAPIEESVVERLQRYHCSCYATYGMTETLSHIALRALNGKNKADYFEALPGVSISKDERNCLVIETPYLAEKIITNDIAEISEPGKFSWQGRWDNIINSGGVKIQPEKIETALAQLLREAGVTNNFFIHSIADSVLGNKVVMILEASDNSADVVEKIIPKISSLEKFERPREILTTPSFITTPTGKINRFKTLENVHSSIPL